ncbi:MAG: chromate reductase, partial [Saprospiraceae bacterium]
GGRGGQTVLETAVSKFERMNKNTVVHFSLPSFGQNFSEENGIGNNPLKSSFEEQLNTFIKAL